MHNEQDKYWHELHYIRKRVDDLAAQVASLNSFVRLGSVIVSGTVSTVLTLVITKVF